MGSCWVLRSSSETPSSKSRVLSLASVSPSTTTLRFILLLVFITTDVMRRLPHVKGGGTKVTVGSRRSALGNRRETERRLDCWFLWLTRIWASSKLLVGKRARGKRRCGFMQRAFESIVGGRRG